MGFGLLHRSERGGLFARTGYYGSDAVFHGDIFGIAAALSTLRSGEQLHRVAGYQDEARYD